MARITTTAHVRAWLRDANPGEAIAYYRGFLALGTDERGRSLGKVERHELLQAAQCLWQAAQHGLVHLVQRRHGPGDFTYLAVLRGAHHFAPRAGPNEGS